MLKIRLSRTGKKHEAHYRIVVTPTRYKRDGQAIAQIGHWHPSQDQLVFDQKSYAEWITKGAQPTAAIRSLLKNI